MNAPTPWDLAPPADYPRRNVVPLHRGYVRPIDTRRTARTLNDAEMIAAIEERLNEARHVTVDERGELRRNNLARFYSANPQFGPRPDEPQLSEAWFYVLGAVTALLWIAAFFIAGREGWF